MAAIASGSETKSHPRQPNSRVTTETRLLLHRKPGMPTRMSQVPKPDLAVHSTLNAGLAGRGAKRRPRVVQPIAMRRTATIRGGSPYGRENGNQRSDPLDPPTGKDRGIYRSGSSSMFRQRATTPRSRVEAVPALGQLRCVTFHPPQDRRVGQRQAPLGHHRDNITQAELVCEVMPPAG